jgi:hypothetical protein
VITLHQITQNLVTGGTIFLASSTVGRVEAPNPTYGTTQTLSRPEEKTPSPTSRHTSLSVHNDENWNTPNPSEP